MLNARKTTATITAMAGLTTLPMASVSADTPARLAFQWQPGMTCSVEQWKVEGGDEVEPARFDLQVLLAGDALAIRFSSFKATPVAGEPKKRRDMRETLGQAQVEMEFTVNPRGDFLSAESVENAQARIAKNEKAGSGGLAMLARTAANNQGALGSKYREAWQVLAANWIGLAVDPSATQTVELQPGVSASVNVSEPHACPGQSSARCVTVRAEMTPPKFGGWKRYELELEPGALIPHSWSEQELMKDHLDDGTTRALAWQEVKRRFTCRMGS